MNFDIPRQLSFLFPAKKPKACASKITFGHQLLIRKYRTLNVQKPKGILVEKESQKFT